jgi:Mrp family chromosome partitioning ATPase
MNEPALPHMPHAPRVKVAKASPDTTGTAAPRPDALRYSYTDTRVLADVRARLLRMGSVVKPDGSALAETFRMLRGQILPRMQADGHHLIAVSSPRAMQSKSLTALNLALTMAADLDTSVLLLDADLSGRGLQQLLGLGGQPGLIEHLLHGARLPGLLINPGIDRFLVLPAGAEPVGNSSELLAAKALQRLVQEMKQRYPDRVIVVDLPPLLDTADALAFLPWADTTLFVAEAQHSRIRDLEAAAELLAPFNLIGTVLSPAPLDPPTARKGWWRRANP